MTNREGVRYFSLDSLNSTGDMFAQAGPFAPDEWAIGTLTYATLPVMPTEGKPIYTSVDGASGALFEMVAGTAGEAETTRFGRTYKGTYDGAQSFTASETHPENDEQGVPAGTYGARISQIMYWANTNMPTLTFGTSEESRGKFSSTLGEGLMAMYPNQTAVGMYNVNLPDDLFEVGGGTDTDTRKTLFAVEASGDTYTAGEYYANNVNVPSCEHTVSSGSGYRYDFYKYSNGLLMISLYWGGTTTHYMQSLGGYGRYVSFNWGSDHAFNGLGYSCFHTWKVGSGFAEPAGMIKQSANAINLYCITNTTGSQSTEINMLCVGRWK